MGPSHSYHAWSFWVVPVWSSALVLKPPRPTQVRWVAPEQLVAKARELYSWHPDGVGSSKLAIALASANLGVLATARNWRTVTSLLALADEAETPPR